MSLKPAIPLNRPDLLNRGILFRFALIFFIVLGLNSHPTSAAVNATPRYLLVSSSSTHSVKRYDATTGAYMDDFVPSGSGGLFGAHDLAFGPDGNLYVVSKGGNGEVLRYNGQTGAFIDTFATNAGGAGQPIGLAFGPTGDLFVSTGNSDSVLWYNGTTGAFKRVFVDSTYLDNPADITFGPDNNLYVADIYHNRVARFNGLTGAFIDEFIPAGVGGMSVPSVMVFGPDGNFYVGSAFSPIVKRYDGVTGAYLGDFTVGGGSAPSDGLVFGPDGNLYVSAGQSGQLVKRFDYLTGNFINEFVTSGSGGLDGAFFLTFSPPAVSGTVAGVKPIRVVCRNQTTSQQVILSDGAAAWDCEAAGLVVNPGETVIITIVGRIN